jgi:hypothetical protein
LNSVLSNRKRGREKSIGRNCGITGAQKKAPCALTGRKRGDLTSLPERAKLIGLIQKAYVNGASLTKACIEADVPIRTYRRWFKAGKIQSDQRPVVVRPVPRNKLSEQEVQDVLDTRNQPEYASLPPSQIVPILLDNGEYIASESTFLPCA